MLTLTVGCVDCVFWVDMADLSLLRVRVDGAKEAASTKLTVPEPPDESPDAGRTQKRRFRRFASGARPGPSVSTRDRVAFGDPIFMYARCRRSEGCSRCPTKREIAAR